jgi:AcrR family transcriptional regulator
MSMRPLRAPGGHRRGVRPMSNQVFMTPPRMHGLIRGGRVQYQPPSGTLSAAMRDKGQENIRRIVDAANGLFYQRGYNQTTFTDIADAAGVPRGNFYYYFKTKDEILHAVILNRLQYVQSMLEGWDRQYKSPRDRIKRYIQILPNSENEVMRYGCPLGSLIVELGKTQVEQQAAVKQIFDLFRGWLERQFGELGYEDRKRELTLHLLARQQGAVIMANVYRDTGFLHKEVDLLNQWLDKL